jgi:malonate-semialdehyde dehydrogenase (acetylating)/methylmalonate-semialdehyde dehydrogenase
MAISVLVCVGNAAEKLLPKIKERIAVMKVGNGLDPASQMGPLITRAHRDRVAGYVEAGAKDGATLLVDGRNLKVPGHENGFFLGPCLLDNVQPSMSVYREEIFGPVLSVVRAKTYDDAMALIHGHVYGNGTAIFTNDGGAARKFQHDVQIGMVGVNVPIPVPMSYSSFGGWKQSLFGDLNIYGPDGVRFYTRNKNVIARWPDPRFRGVDLGFPQNK